MSQKRDKFLSVLENHKGVIYKIVNSYCKDNADRQDLIQEIIVQLWLSFDKYDRQFKLSTWIYRIALNTSISYYRKHKIRKERTVELPPILRASIKTDEAFQENPDVLLLQSFIQELKEIDKALILLYLDGVSQKEIAEITGLTTTNISTKIARIKKTLKKRFQTVKSQRHEG